MFYENIEQPKFYDEFKLAMVITLDKIHVFNAGSVPISRYLGKVYRVHTYIQRIQLYSNQSQHTGFVFNL